jgi:hypothetical protein
MTGQQIHLMMKEAAAAAAATTTRRMKMKMTMMQGSDRNKTNRKRSVMLRMFLFHVRS